MKQVPVVVGKDRVANAVKLTITDLDLALHDGVPDDGLKDVELSVVGLCQDEILAVILNLRRVLLRVKDIVRPHHSQRKQPLRTFPVDEHLINAEVPFGLLEEELLKLDIDVIHILVAVILPALAPLIALVGVTCTAHLDHDPVSEARYGHIELRYGQIGGNVLAEVEFVADLAGVYIDDTEATDAGYDNLTLAKVCDPIAVALSYEFWGILAEGEVASARVILVHLILVDPDNTVV